MLSEPIVGRCEGSVTAKIGVSTVPVVNLVSLHLAYLSAMAGGTDNCAGGSRDSTRYRWWRKNRTTCYRWWRKNCTTCYRWWFWFARDVPIAGPWPSPGPGSGVGVVVFPIWER